jgi:hypothetical protein
MPTVAPHDGLNVEKEYKIKGKKKKCKMFPSTGLGGP